MMHRIEKKESKTYTPEEITAYIEENVGLQQNSLVTIWDTPSGLKYTRGTMEYREEGYEVVLYFRTMDEVPEGEDLKHSVEYLLDIQTNI